MERNRAAYGSQLVSIHWPTELKPIGRGSLTIIGVDLLPFIARFSGIFADTVLPKFGPASRNYTNCADTGLRNSNRPKTVGAWSFKASATSLSLTNSLRAVYRQFPLFLVPLRHPADDRNNADET